MKSFLFSILFFAILAIGCAHSPSSTPSKALSVAAVQSYQLSGAMKSEWIPVKFAEMPGKQEAESPDHGEDADDLEDGDEVEIADSLKPFERKTFALGEISYSRPFKPIGSEYAAGLTILQPGEKSEELEDEFRRAEVKSENTQAGMNETNENFDEDLGEARGAEEKTAKIADPLESINRAMFLFNDKFYFWALKPVAQGYSKVVPEAARASVKNFFTNLAFPVRFVSCLLQADINCAGRETARFTVNTILGIGGLLDLSQEANLPKQNLDLGQTLGIYGLGNGFYIVWPILGSSTLRDSVGIVGDFFLYPVSYIRPWYLWLAVRGYQEVNATSLRIGDYESLKKAAIDPYLAMRDAYIQYRKNLIEMRKVKSANPGPSDKPINRPKE